MIEIWQCSKIELDEAFEWIDIIYSTDNVQVKY